MDAKLYRVCSQAIAKRIARAEDHGPQTPGGGIQFVVPGGFSVWTVRRHVEQGRAIRCYKCATNLDSQCPAPFRDQMSGVEHTCLISLPHSVQPRGVLSRGLRNWAMGYVQGYCTLSVRSTVRIPNRNIVVPRNRLIFSETFKFCGGE